MNEPRKLIRDIVAARRPRLYRLCKFCGKPSRGPACAQHRDLLALDPHSPVYRTDAKEADDE